MNVLITGGSGYIGSHTAVVLLEAGYNVIIVDNFINSSVNTIDKIEKIAKKKVRYIECDITNKNKIEEVFKVYGIDAVIHFAGLKAVSESVTDPIKYYHNNVFSTLILLEACLKYNVNKFVFSSSATVYGDSRKVPFVENMELKTTTNPYGESKAMSERIIKDIVHSEKSLSISILRYFNPVGAHESGIIGEDPKGIPNNLMPYITNVALKKYDKVRVFGNDYPTSDGTGVRDYIHVMDVAEGHLAALNSFRKGAHIYNLGTGKGTSVLQLLAAFEEATSIKIPIELTARRRGDIAECYAEVHKARIELNWSAKRDLTTMCRDAWKYAEINH